MGLLAIAPGGHCWARVFRDQVSVYGRGGHYALRRGANNGCREVHYVPRDPHTWHVTQSSRICPDELAKSEWMGCRLESKRGQYTRACNHGCAGHHHLARNNASIL